MKRKSYDQIATAMAQTMPISRPFLLIRLLWCWIWLDRRGRELLVKSAERMSDAP